MVRGTDIFKLFIFLHGGKSSKAQRLPKEGASGYLMVT